MHAGINALLLEGYKLHEEPIQLSLAAIERFHRKDNHGKRLQCSLFPVWDTVLMIRTFCEPSHEASQMIGSNIQGFSVSFSSVWSCISALHLNYMPYTRDLLPRMHIDILSVFLLITSTQHALHQHRTSPTPND
ncbi:hypothetical protein BO82DRAFT_176328 [Aspergillus uvarum CBS 121591]|uniref:Uncharacterized protein n=1 Tax=Aspergillus uvarum CBS 121591 TaxID=1448315 RepID=A0A319CGI9_9EURO|nr:hypothetical protein BO82DRAFT_176328 [Aspergillus uvarum CBS 121591]PYH77713.1 hypothetical protein BO82DRAFT_176328 [Aspergillus uvarum CBS 121591]